MTTNFVIRKHGWRATLATVLAALWLSACGGGGDGGDIGLAASGQLSASSQGQPAGQPAAGAQVQLWQRQPAGQPTRHSVLRTNKNGRLLLRLSGPGPYLLAAVVMIPMPRPAPAAMPPADWLSTWASLTFAGPAAPLTGRR